MQWKTPTSAVLIILAVSGCTGTIGAGEGGVEASPSGVAGTNGVDTGVTGVTAESCQGLLPSAGPAPLRRLTREQYDHTVRDLLGDESAPAAAFERDDAVGGFESNGVVPVSPANVLRFRDAAETLAEGAREHLAALLPCEPSAVGEPACAKAFIESFGRRAYRRALRPDETDRLFTLYEGRRATSDFASGVQLVVTALLQSPHFLYRVEAPAELGAKTEAVSSAQLATRLSYFFWQSTPDETLLTAAELGQLDTAEKLKSQAERLLRDPKADAGIRSLFRQWFGLDGILTVDKNELLHPDFTDEVRAALLEEGLSFASSVMQGEAPTTASLFGANYTMLSPALAAFYGLPAPAGPGFSRVGLADQRRGGMLKLGAFLGVTAHASAASPILRGKFVRQSLLCQPVQPPPPGVNPEAPARQPGTSTKQWLEQHRGDPYCAGCHRVMDPIGFGFQHYDAVGRYTDTDGDLPADATGEIIGGGDASGAFDGLTELSAQLAGSAEVRGCVARQVTRYALGRPDAVDDECSLLRLREKLTESGGNLRALMLDVVTSDAFRFRKVEP